MTIEEWIKKQKEIIENLSRDNEPKNEEQKEIRAFYDGVKYILNALSRCLPTLSHEVTLKEVVKMCGDCNNCHYPVSPSNPMGCWFEDIPSTWDIEGIEKRVRETVKDTRVIDPLSEVNLV